MPGQEVYEAEIQDICERTSRMLFEGANPHLRYQEGRRVIYCEETTQENDNGCENTQEIREYLPKVCRCGYSEDVKLVMECAHCEGSVCGEEGCLRECQVCHQKLCHLCTILDYSGKLVRPFCLTCLSRKMQQS